MFRYLGILNHERLVVTSPEALAEVILRVYDFPKSAQIKLLAEPLLGMGLVLTNGDQHKRQRKMLLPSFAAKHIKALYPIYWGKARELTAKLTDLFTNPVLDLATEEKSSVEPGTVVLEIGEWASRAALDVITMAALGLDFGALKDPQTTLNRTYRIVFEPTRMFQYFSYLKLIFPSWLVHSIPVKRNYEALAAVAAIRNTCRELIRTKKAEIANCDDKTKKKDLLNLVLQSENIPDEEAVDQIMTFLAAGHETSSVSITWAVYMLCVHPEWQGRLRSEIRSFFPSPSIDDGVVEPADIDHMPLLSAFCNELLRYWPPIPLTARQAAYDTKILNQFVPRGTKVIVPIFGTNRDERLWGADSRQFRPERWMTKEGKLDATGGAVSKYAFMSFNHGPRMCIGQGFARAEMVCLLAALVGRFEFELKDPADLNEDNIVISGGGFSAKPKHGIWVKTKIVEGW